MDSSEFRRVIPGFTRVANMRNREYKMSDPVGTVYLEQQSTHRFNFVFDQGLIPEAQTCRLLKYLTFFDPRVTPLLRVVRYWAKVNKIRFAQYCVTNPDTPHITPEPSGMEWLVMFFLIHERVVPSPREIAARSHEPLIYKCERGQVDIGFSMDGDYHKKWNKSSPSYVSNAEFLKDPESDAFLLCVFKLAWQFFNFYSSRINRWVPVVFNMRDGEILKVKDILYKNPGNGWTTKLETPEVGILKGTPKLKDSKMFLLHPLSMKCSFSVCEHTFLTIIRPVMKQTEIKLEKMFEKVGTAQEERLQTAHVDLSVFNADLTERIDPAMKKRKGNRVSASACVTGKKKR